ncbi:hypothetical protein [Paenibacillus pseudetheri]|nr:hypothetical protein [Paenibacillus pseudetheri]
MRIIKVQQVFDILRRARVLPEALLDMSGAIPGFFSTKNSNYK